MNKIGYKINNKKISFKNLIKNQAKMNKIGYKVNNKIISSKI